MLPNKTILLPEHINEAIMRNTTICILLTAVSLSAYKTEAQQNIANPTLTTMTSDFTTTLVVDQTPEDVFRAVTDVRGWWSEEIEGETARQGDEFNYHYKDVHAAKMKLVEVIPNQKVVWLVVDNYFQFTKDKKEWTGNKIIFDITNKGDKTELRFTQQGLVPAYECYDVCSSGWGNYINKSLYSLITTGKGQPSPKESAFNDQLLQQHKKKQ
jgi:uncharacterized protein YndB with AHSA1/START domain